jgi:hypothetical protein
MAEAGLFLGWGTGISGREARSLQMFQEEVLPFFQRHQDDGTIESYEVVFLEPHGGDLDGFILARGSREGIVTLRSGDDYRRLMTRGQFVVSSLGAVGATLADGIEEGIGMYQEAVNDLG